MNGTIDRHWQYRAALTRFGRTALLVCVVAAIPSCRDAGSDKAAFAAGPQLIATPADSTLHSDSLSISVRRGRALLNSTADSLKSHVGNSLRCTSCHLDDGRRAFAMAWVGVSARYPQYRARSGKDDQLPDRINDCFERSLNGTKLDTAGRDMRDIVAYMTWISQGVAAGGKVKGQGIDSLAPLTPDPVNGAKLYTTLCARCHGADGGGVPGPRLFRGSENTIASALWGPESFNIGAGMARIRVAAAFIARQMPIEANRTLTPQEAFDIAGFVTSKPRPDFARKAQDWPKGGAPPDVAYMTDFVRRSR